MPASPADDVRAPGRRSRHGCHGCRVRRKKCDEAIPTCNACAERNIECVYPKASNARHSKQILSCKTASVPETLLEISRPHVALKDNEQLLVKHFAGALTSLLSFRLNDASNDFCVHLLPLAQSSSVVLGAVETISSAHLHMLGSKPLNEVGNVHSTSLKLLSGRLSSGSLDGASGEVALTATLLMVYYEVILGDSAENALCHLKGAKAILDQLDIVLKTLPNARIGFLMKIYHYFDVMIALSLRKPPLSLPYNPDNSLGTIDAIFGLTAGLWPTLHLVAQVLANKDHLMDDMILSQAQDLAEQLSETNIVESTSLHLPAGGQAEVDLEALVQISNAYRASVLLVLHNEVLNMHDPEVVSRVYHQALDSLLRIAALDGPMATYSTSVWPLFTVGKYAQSASDRIILRRIFLKIYRRHHMKVVDTAEQSMNQLWMAGVDENFGTPSPVFFA